MLFVPVVLVVLGTLGMHDEAVVPVCARACPLPLPLPLPLSLSLSLFLSPSLPLPLPPPLSLSLLLRPVVPQMRMLHAPSS